MMIILGRHAIGPILSMHDEQKWAWPHQ